MEGPKQTGLSYYVHVQFRNVELKKGDKVRIVENKKKNIVEYGEIAFFELDRTTKNVVL
jgi:hypothetical protein